MKKSTIICGLLALVGMLSGMVPPAFAKTVTLAWDRSTDPAVVGYKVYYRADSSSLPFSGIGAAEGNSPVNVSSAATATLSGLDDTKSHYFAVVAYNANGVESSLSNIVSSAATPVNPGPTLSSLAISGPTSVNESSYATFAATATWSNGSTNAITPVWSENSAYATIDANGVLTTSAVSSNRTVTLTASYSSGGVTKTATKSVTIVDVPEQSCTDEDGDGFAVEGGVCGDVDPDDYDPLNPDSGKTPLDDTSEFAKQLYRDMFNREGDAGGISYWTNQIDSAKITKSQAAEIFLLSAEHQYKVASIARLYLAYFKRCPDFSGLMYWVTNYAQGLPLEEVSLAFAEAPEFQNTYGNLSNGHFVDLVYQNVLGRDPEPEGLHFWTSQLDTGNYDRGQVMVGFSESEEFKAYSQAEIFVSNAFSCLVRRSPSQTEYNSWVSSIKAGGSKRQLIDTLLKSSEYAARFGS